MAGAYQFYGTEIRDYHYKFVIPVSVDRAVVKVRAVNASISIFDFRVAVSDELPMVTFNGAGSKFVAHLGMLGLAPRNTMPAFSLARRAGFNQCVTNTNITKDGVIVALHNDTIDETSNGSGNVCDMTFEELRKYDFGSYYHSIYANAVIPTLDEVLAFMSSCGMRPVIRLSSNIVDEHSCVLEEIWKLVIKHGLTDRCTVKAFTKQVLTDFSKIAGNKVRYGLWCYDFSLDDINWFKTLGPDVYFDVKYINITQELVDSDLNNGVPVEAWIVNSFPLLIKLSNMGITGFTTDYFALDGCIY